MNNLLNSGFEFDSSENQLKFKFRLLNSCLLVAIVFAFLIGLLHELGLHNTGGFHAKMNFIFSFGALILMIWLRRSKTNYSKVAHSLIGLSLVTFTSAYIFVIEDQFRIIWFYISVFVAYTVISPKAGIITTLLAAAIIILGYLIFELGLSQITVQGALLGLIISSLLAYVHVRKIEDFEQSLINKNRELEILATVDGLTGVMNKRMFNEMMSKYLEAAHRNKKPLSFLYLDLDHFKKINDAHGHQVGDIMLIKFTDIVDKCLRKSDLLGRVGGEEFAAVLFETDLNSAMNVAEKIRQKVEETSYSYEQEMVTMTTSIGVAQLEFDNDSVDSIQKRADDALYQAKDTGRNRVEWSVHNPMSQLSMFSEEIDKSD